VPAGATPAGASAGPAATGAVTIAPPNTGDAGLAGRHSHRMALVLLIVAPLVAGAAFAVGWPQSRID
jgi:hypothetical protein